jgi:hypothetical protein
MPDAEQVERKHFRGGACMFRSQLMQSPALQYNNGKDTQGYDDKYGYLFHAGCFLKRRPGTEKVAKRYEKLFQQALNCDE